MASSKNKLGVFIFIAVMGFIFLMVYLCEEDGTATISDPAYEDMYTDEDAAADTGWPPGLEQAGLNLEEDKLKRNYYLILDGSGSMSGSKMDEAKAALTNFIGMVPEGANLALMVFDAAGLSERAALGSPRDLIRERISGVTAEGWTPLKSALEQAYQKISFQGTRQLGYGEYNIVVVTDGEASGGEEPDRIVNRILKESPVVIHTIGFQIGTSHSLNQPGRILYKPADNYEELKEGLEEVLAEMEDFSVTDF